LEQVALLLALKQLEMPDQNLFLALSLQTVGLVPVGPGQVPFQAERVAALHQETA